MTCLCVKFNVDRYGTNMNGMPEHADNLCDWKSRLQIYGVLQKRSNSKSNWMRR